ncbi:MAG: UDP-3-O-(3-hydroxymyristoyl)glucosamine N-acyltransferase [Alphaproteobacteria bacterium]|nr:UDP-3-O-(3-hydroxymyristoyl)glucosamine N-acyltransferase [Alphaproteobacteria bacterium]
MPDPRFHRVAGPFSLADLARASGAEARPGDRADMFRDVGTIDAAGPDDVVYVENKRYIPALAACGAGLCIMRPEIAAEAPPGMALLLTPAPQRAFTLVARAFYPPPAPVPGIAASAVIDSSAVIGDGCEIGPGVVIGAEARIGEGCILGPGVAIGRGVVIGPGARIGHGVSVSHALVGGRVTMHPGVRIGQDGFGLIPGAAGHLAIPQLGRVIVHDDVEIGANSTIDRGALGDTVIGQGCFIDNLVQIGHNVRLGRGCIIVAQVGISGSTIVGDFVMMGGQAGVSGHLEIGDGARVAAKGGVLKDVPAGVTVGGHPAMPLTEWLRQGLVLRRLTKGKGA